jgi:hypothetical protein
VLIERKNDERLQENALRLIDTKIDVQISLDLLHLQRNGFTDMRLRCGKRVVNVIVIFMFIERKSNPHRD